MCIHLDWLFAMQAENKNTTNEPRAEVLRKLAAEHSQRIVGIQYLKQKTIGDVARHAMQLRWMHQRVPQQPDYHQVCMEWYDFRLIKTVITVLLSAFHNVSIKIYGVS